MIQTSTLLKLITDLYMPSYEVEFLYCVTGWAYSLYETLCSAQHCLPSAQTAGHLREASQETAIHASSSSVVNKWDVRFDPTVKAHLGLKEGVCSAWRGPIASLQPPAPRGHVIKTPRWGVIQPLLSLASQAGVFLHLSRSALIYIPPAMTPLFPILTHPPLLNTHRGPINPIMQM